MLEIPYMIVSFIADITLIALNYLLNLLIGITLSISNFAIQSTFYAIFFTQRTVYLLLNISILSPLLLSFRLSEYVLKGVLNFLSPIIHINQLKDSLKLILFFSRLLQLNLILIIALCVITILLINRLFFFTVRSRTGTRPSFETSSLSTDLVDLHQILDDSVKQQSKQDTISRDYNHSNTAEHIKNYFPDNSFKQYPPNISKVTSSQEMNSSESKSPLLYGNPIHTIEDSENHNRSGTEDNSLTESDIDPSPEYISHRSSNMNTIFTKRLDSIGSDITDFNSKSLSTNSNLLTPK
ncbi:hypothetical protein WICPIJ_007848 [Wickerhamomyces pijperi]|uniref:Uncharacterized protein n=1 Tax=Wickerhamomyces pijperi TaxID=599730 RepID=A0A9P8TIU0_WICPI|nr:hypothetical protein WICPIJ_007848 [Wickerhamomyces pijperi]